MCKSGPTFIRVHLFSVGLVLSFFAKPAGCHLSRSASLKNRMEDGSDSPDGSAGDADGQIDTKSFSAWNWCTRTKDAQDKQIWACTFCSMTFKDWNASKALAHIAKAPGFSIKPCTSSSMSSAEAALFKAVVAEKTASSLKKRQQVEVREEVSAGLTSTMSQIAKKPRGPAPVFGSGKTMTQQNVPAMLILQNDVDLTTQIGNFFHANGLDFALVDTFAFKCMIKSAGKQSSGFVTPGRKKLAKELLDANYATRIAYRDTSLRLNIAENGLTFMGDGATVNRTPLINLLASNGSSGLHHIFEPIDRKRGHRHVARIVLHPIHDGIWPARQTHFVQAHQLWRSRT